MEHLCELPRVLGTRLQLVWSLSLDDILNLVEEVLVVTFDFFCSLCDLELGAQVRLLDQMVCLEGVHGPRGFVVDLCDALPVSLVVHIVVNCVQHFARALQLN